MELHPIVPMAYKSNNRLRTLVAQEAARIILEEGVKDYQLAKRKAVERLGSINASVLPRNKEIEQALRNHQSLFFTREDYNYLNELWQIALDSMQLLKAFTPRLVGSVLEGTAGRHSDINLHVFSETVENVIFVFLDKGIPYRSSEKRLRFNIEPSRFPCILFSNQNVDIEVVVLKLEDLRRVPISAIDGRPIKRADIAAVEKHVAEI